MASVEPNDEALVARKLARSLEVARQFADDFLSSTTSASSPAPALVPAAGGGSGGAQDAAVLSGEEALLASDRGRAFVPFDKQRKVEGEEQIFRVCRRVFVGSEYAAADVGLLRGLGISRVMNITSGARTVPNFGERVAGWDVEYTSYPLQDRIGFPVASIVEAMDDAVARLDAWDAEDRAVLVHCSAGLCRSASIIMAWLMRRASSPRLTLAEAVEAYTEARGRPPAPSPSYWSALVSEERSAAREAGVPDASTRPPTFDFTESVCGDLSIEGGAGSLQLAPRDEVIRLLREFHWNPDAVVRALLP